MGTVKLTEQYSLPPKPSSLRFSIFSNLSILNFKFDSLC